MDFEKEQSRIKKDIKKFKKMNLSELEIEKRIEKKYGICYSLKGR